jgi:hypothetical protein
MAIPQAERMGYRFQNRLDQFLSDRQDFQYEKIPTVALQSLRKWPDVRAVCKGLMLRLPANGGPWCTPGETGVPRDGLWSIIVIRHKRLGLTTFASSGDSRTATIRKMQSFNIYTEFATSIMLAGTPNKTKD